VFKATLGGKNGAKGVGMDVYYKRKGKLIKVTHVRGVAVEEMARRLNETYKRPESSEGGKGLEINKQMLEKKWK